MELRLKCEINCSTSSIVYVYKSIKPYPKLALLSSNNFSIFFRLLLLRFCFSFLFAFVSLLIYCRFFLCNSREGRVNYTLLVWIVKHIGPFVGLTWSCTKPRKLSYWGHHECNQVIVLSSRWWRSSLRNKLLGTYSKLWKLNLLTWLLANP